MEKVTKKFEEEIKVLKDEIKLKDKEIDRLRMCILKYRKIPMTKYKALRKVGISEYKGSCKNKSYQFYIKTME